MKDEWIGDKVCPYCDGMARNIRQEVVRQDVMVWCARTETKRKELARLMGYTESHLSRLLKGTRNWRAEDLEKLWALIGPEKPAQVRRVHDRAMVQEDVNYDRG